MQELILEYIPATEAVHVEAADRLWAKRRSLFFKPAAGFGGRAAYHGDELTKRVWSEILAGNYIAQTIVPPGQRAGGTKTAPEIMKFDIRCYAYAGAVQ